MYNYFSLLYFSQGLCSFFTFAGLSHRVPSSVKDRSHIDWSYGLSCGGRVEMMWRLNREWEARALTPRALAFYSGWRGSGDCCALRSLWRQCGEKVEKRWRNLAGKMAPLRRRLLFKAGTAFQLLDSSPSHGRSCRASHSHVCTSGASPMLIPAQNSPKP